MLVVENKKNLPSKTESNRLKRRREKKMTREEIVYRKTLGDKTKLKEKKKRLKLKTKCGKVQEATRRFS